MDSAVALLNVLENHEDMNKMEKIHFSGFDQGTSLFPSMSDRRFKVQPRDYKRHSKIRQTKDDGRSDISEINSVSVSKAKYRSNLHKCMTEESRRGRRLKVKRLIISGAEVDCRDQDGCTPLMLALQCGHYNTTKLLLDKAADPNAMNRNGDTPLTLCTRTGSKWRGADVNVKKNEQQQLTTEFSDPMKKIVQHTSGVPLNIVQHTSDVPLNNSINIQKGYTDLNIDTVGDGHEPGVFLGGRYSGPDLKEDSTQRQRHLSPSTFLSECYSRTELKTWARTLGSLHMAASEDDKALMQILVELGADVNGVYREQTPLMAAVTSGAVHLLIRQGADVDTVVMTSVGKRTALLHALSPLYITAVKTQVGAENVFNELDVIVRRLVQEGTSLTETDADGNTPIMAACEIAGAGSVLGFLLGAGVVAQQMNAGGESVLHLAARSKVLENVEIVSQHCHVEVDLGNRMGVTALMIAAMNKNRDIMEHLIRMGASVNKQDNIGNTSLMYAVRSCKGDTEHITVLLEAGANPNIKNETGFCPLTLAAADLSDPVLRVFLMPQFGLKEESKEKALHLLLAGNLLTPIVRTCAMTLLEHNTKSSSVDPSVIHKFIADGHVELVEKLISNGTPPSDVKRDDPRILGYCWPVASTSPLCAALLSNQHGLARRIAEQWFLTPSDFKLSSNPQLKEYLLRNKYTECLNLLQGVANHVISLKVLSFTAISAAVGNGRQRPERIEKLQLPEIVKNMLLFQSENKPQGKLTPNFVKQK